MVWAKGYTELVELMGQHAAREGSQPHIDCYGNGEDLQDVADQVRCLPWYLLCWWFSHREQTSRSRPSLHTLGVKSLPWLAHDSVSSCHSPTGAR